MTRIKISHVCLEQCYSMGRREAGTFAARLRAARLAARLSVQALSDLIGTSRQRVNQWETRGHIPDWRMGCRCCRALGVPYEALDPEAVDTTADI